MLSGVRGGVLARGIGPTVRNDWQVERSSELFELKYGKALVESTRAPGEVPVFGTNGQTGTHNLALFRGPGVIIGRKGAGHLGVHWSDRDYWVIDTAYSLVPSERMDLKFSYYLIKYVGLNHLKHGTSNPSLTRDAFGAQYFPVPSLLEQRAIAATLGALDDRIESNRRVVAIAEQLGDALFAAAASESRLLADVADITMGSSPKGADLNEDGDGLPFYQGTRDFGVRFPSLRIWTTAPVRTAAKSDTLMSVRAPVGELNRASTDCCIGRGVAAIHSDTHPSTLYYAMRSSSSVWDKFQGDGTVFASVNKTDVHGAEIRWVGDGALLELESELNAIDARIESLESETRRLITLREALLPELLSGRIRVSAEGVAA